MTRFFIFITILTMNNLNVDKKYMFMHHMSASLMWLRHNSVTPKSGDEKKEIVTEMRRNLKKKRRPTQAVSYRGEVSCFWRRDVLKKDVKCHVVSWFFDLNVSKSKKNQRKIKPRQTWKPSWFAILSDVVRGFYTAQPFEF